MEIKKINELYRMVKEVYVLNCFEGTPCFLKLPRVVCADGFTMSCQAGSALYSWPREDLAPEYSAFEIGYPSEYEPLLAEYVEFYDEGEPKWTLCVYPFVPYEVIDAVIEKHGGIVDLR